MCYNFLESKERTKFTQNKKGRSMGGVFGHLSSLSHKIFGGSEDGILKDFTPKAVEKAQNIIKERIKTGILNKGKVKFSLEINFLKKCVLLIVFDMTHNGEECTIKCGIEKKHWGLDWCWTINGFLNGMKRWNYCTPGNH